MICFGHDKSKLIVNIETDLESRAEHTARLAPSWECGQPYLADALARHMARIFQDRIEKIRQDAYAKGWKDAKAKRKKATCFACTTSDLRDGGCF